MTFEAIAAVSDIELGQGLRREFKGRAIAIFEVDGNYHAIDDLCTHGNASLADGWQEGCEIECPLHQGRFDVTNGKALTAPCTDDVRSYPLRIQDGAVMIKLE